MALSDGVLGDYSTWAGIHIVGVVGRVGLTLV